MVVNSLVSVLSEVLKRSGALVLQFLPCPGHAQTKPGLYKNYAKPDMAFFDALTREMGLTEPGQQA